ncbi:MAG: ABC transporter permease [Candidatus Cloacimonetes bacterium]|nr:ABC transporter permease [Candidatus Cloacimonadota bacterium]
MFLFDAINSSLQTILNHKFRSLLTLLGILIGITSVVAMFSSVNGIRLVIAENIEGMGWTNMLVVNSGAQRGMRGRGFGRMGGMQTAARRAIPLTYRDYEALREELDTKYIYGMVESWNRNPISREWFRVRATNEDYFHANTFYLKEGRFFNAFELSRGMKVAIVGPTFSEDHFKGEDPLGKYYTTGGHRYQIIGILDEDPLNKAGTMQFNPWQRNWDLQAVYIPLRTGAMYLSQNMSINYIAMHSHDSEGFADMRNRATQILLARRNMNRDFSFQDVSAEILQFTQQMDEMLKNWGIALFIIATVSLLVGGIGLFSTLLISINERMIEIGIRKSVGARDLDIFFYFIIESVTLSAIAAIIGIILGLLLTQALGMALKTTIPISILSIYLGIGFAFLIGFLSGLYPAIKASKINPIQAIYYFE